MRLGHIKHTGGVAHILERDPEGCCYEIACDGSPWDGEEIKFNSHMLPCKRCISKFRGQYDQASEALAKLGVIP